MNWRTRKNVVDLEPVTKRILEPEPSYPIYKPFFFVAMVLSIISSPVTILNHLL